MTTKNLTPDHLSGFTGTTQWYRWSLLFPWALITDGTKYLADNGAAWLIDLICSHQKTKKVQDEPFQVWHLRLNPYCEANQDPNDITLKIKGMYLGKLKIPEKEKYEVVGEDGNWNIVARQTISYTDFPLELFDDFYIYAVWSEDEDGKRVLIICLPSED